MLRPDWESVLARTRRSVRRLHRSLHVSAEWDYHEPLGEAFLSRPVNIYSELEARLPSWPVADISSGPPYAVDAHFLLIDTDEGATGICGPVGDEDIAIIKRYFVDILIGEDPQAVERIWDKMYRHSIHGRKGTPMMALSKVDLALWDLKGKLLGAPVYQLLGGPTRKKIRAYASMLGYSLEPSKVIERTRHFRAQGFTAFKWFLPCAPKDSEPGHPQESGGHPRRAGSGRSRCRSDVRRLEQLECALHLAHGRAFAGVSPDLV